jgi:solute carrier family 25 folate transporter 32
VPWLTHRLVNQGAQAHIGGSIGIVRDILRKEGALQGLYRGLTPNIVGNSISWGLYFMWYANIKDGIQTYQRGGGKLTGTDYFIASGAAGQKFSARSAGPLG